nr:glycosyltransferase family 4 protein [Pseudoalteromonas shioyasakiensis]
MGGVETHCEELYKRLPRNIKVLVYGRKGYCEDKVLSDTLKIKSLLSPKLQALETPLHTLLAIFHCYIYEKVDVFHIHGIGASIFLPLAKLLFPKVVVTHHSQNYEHQKWGKLAKTVFRLGEKFTLKYADQVYFVSRTLLANSKARFPLRADHYYFMANGFSLPDSCTRLNDIDFPFFLAVGRLVPEKGFHDLIEAFNKHIGDEKLIIAGAADFESSYARKLKQNANSNVLFVGKKTRSELKWLYSHCNSFVMPSYSEGLPISALEAVSCSAPILMSDIVQNKDLDFPESCYFELGNIQAIATRLKNGGITVDKKLLDNYNWDKIAKNYVSLVDEGAH